MVVVNGIDNVLFFVFTNLPHGPTHHMTSGIGSDCQTVALTWSEGRGEDHEDIQKGRDRVRGLSA